MVKEYIMYERIVYHPKYVQLLSFLNTVSGREKALRTAQYLVRLIASCSKSDLVEYVKLKKLQYMITFSRKPFRFLKFLQFFRNLLITLDNQLQDNQLKAFSVIKQVGFTAYFFLDAIQWFKLLGLIGSKKSHSSFIRNVGVYSQRCWLIALTGGVLFDSRKMYINYRRKAALQNSKKNTSSDEFLVNMKCIAKTDEFMDLTQKLLDSIVALKGSLLINTDERIASASGLITSITSIRKIWESCRK